MITAPSMAVHCSVCSSSSSGFRVGEGDGLGDVAGDVDGDGEGLGEAEEVSTVKYTVGEEKFP